MDLDRRRQVRRKLASPSAWDDSRADLQGQASSHGLPIRIKQSAKIVCSRAIGRWIIVWVFLGTVIVPPVLGQTASTTIVPGYTLGPVVLGTPAEDARRAAVRFKHETGCDIDLLIAGGVVVAAGTSWGGCLALQPPKGMQPLLVSTDPFFQSVTFGMSGSPAALANAFGAPLIVCQGADSVALIFTNGLVAYIGVMHQGGVVTYLAVQTPGSRLVPPIGYFTDKASGHTIPLRSDGGSGNGSDPAPTSPWGGSGSIAEH